MNKLRTLLASALTLAALALAPRAHAQASPTTYRVDTINALLNITLYGTDPKVMAYAGGATARDDGGGGLFFFDGSSSAATNVYMVYKPVNNNGRWFKLPTSVANQNSAVTASDETSYAWNMMYGKTTHVLGIGADASKDYIQSWGSRTLELNNQGNVVRVNGGDVEGGGFAVGGSGATLKAIYSAAATVDFPSIAASTTSDQTITVTGAGTNSAVAIGTDSTTLETGVMLFGWVSATNTVTVRAANVSGSTAVNPAARAIRATVFQY